MLKDPLFVIKSLGLLERVVLRRDTIRVLQGELGYRICKTLVLQIKKLHEIEKRDPVEDQNLILNVDLNLQKKINELFQGKSGVAIVMRVNGEVLAAVSYPSYDPNLFVGGISHKKWKEIIDDLNHPFTNKIVSGLYPPGSTIKMGMALAFSSLVRGSRLEAKRYLVKGFIIPKFG